MKKVLDKALETRIARIIEESDNLSEGSDQAATPIVALLKELQDASGVKVCMNVTVTDVAYKEV